MKAGDGVGDDGAEARLTRNAEFEVHCTTRHVEIDGGMVSGAGVLVVDNDLVARL